MKNERQEQCGKKRDTENFSLTKDLFKIIYATRKGRKLVVVLKLGKLPSQGWEKSCVGQVREGWVFIRL